MLPGEMWFISDLWALWMLPPRPWQTSGQHPGPREQPFPPQNLSKKKQIVVATHCTQDPGSFSVDYTLFWGQYRAALVPCLVTVTPQQRIPGMAKAPSVYTVPSQQRGDPPSHWVFLCVQNTYRSQILFKLAEISRRWVLGFIFILTRGNWSPQTTTGSQ